MILSDTELKRYIDSGRLRIEPFEPEVLRENGLDLRIGYEVAHLLNTDEVMDVRETRVEGFYKIEKVGDEGFVIGPREHILTITLEYISLPNDLMAFCQLRSTFARLGLFIPPTIIDAGFEGQLTIELVGGPFPVRIYPGTRFLHVVFSKLTSPVKRPYKGKYQGQRGVTLPRMDRNP